MPDLIIVQKLKENYFPRSNIVINEKRSILLTIIICKCLGHFVNTATTQIVKHWLQQSSTRFKNHCTWIINISPSVNFAFIYLCLAVNYFISRLIPAFPLPCQLRITSHWHRVLSEDEIGLHGFEGKGRSNTINMNDHTWPANESWINHVVFKFDRLWKACIWKQRSM